MDTPRGGLPKRHLHHGPWAANRPQKPLATGSDSGRFGVSCCFIRTYIKRMPSQIVDSKLQNTGSKLQIVDSELQDSDSKIQVPRPGASGHGFGASSHGFGASDRRFRASNPRFRALRRPFEASRHRFEASKSCQNGRQRPPPKVRNGRAEQSLTHHKPHKEDSTMPFNMFPTTG